MKSKIDKNLKICGVYAIILKNNNKRYIGSSKNIYSRWARHLWELKNRKHQNPYLLRCYIKYGIKNLEIKVLCACNENELEKKERYFIDFYDAFNPIFGLNILDPLRQLPMKQSTKDKIRKALLGRKRPLEVIEKMRQSMTGKKESKEHKEKISKALKGIKRTPEFGAKISATKRRKYKRLIDGMKKIGIVIPQKKKATYSLSKKQLKNLRKYAFNRKGKKWTKNQRLAYEKRRDMEKLLKIS